MSDDNKENSSTSADTDVEVDYRISEPDYYAVILLNDHYTTMDFVIFILESIFDKSKIEAEDIMLQVHNNGSGIAGIYIKEIAETKINEVHQLAKANEFPLKCKMSKSS